MTMRDVKAIRREGSAALDLINEAAAIMKEIEERAASTEARAETVGELARKAIASAEERILAAEQGAAETVARAEAIAQDARKMMERAQECISSLEAALTAAETRAKAAEMKTAEARTALIAVQEAILNKGLERTKRQFGRIRPGRLGSLG